MYVFKKYRSSIDDAPSSTHFANLNNFTKNIPQWIIIYRRTTIINDICRHCPIKISWICLKLSSLLSFQLEPILDHMHQFLRNVLLDFATKSAHRNSQCNLYLSTIHRYSSMTLFDWTISALPISSRSALSALNGYV